MEEAEKQRGGGIMDRTGEKDNRSAKMNDKGKEEALIVAGRHLEDRKEAPKDNSQQKQQQQKANYQKQQTDREPNNTNNEWNQRQENKEKRIDDGGQDLDELQKWKDWREDECDTEDGRDEGMGDFVGDDEEGEHIEDDEYERETNYEDKTDGREVENQRKQVYREKDEETVSNERRRRAIYEELHQKNGRHEHKDWAEEEVERGSTHKGRYDGRGRGEHVNRKDDESRRWEEAKHDEDIRWANTRWEDVRRSDSRWEDVMRDIGREDTRWEHARSEDPRREDARRVDARRDDIRRDDARRDDARRDDARRDDARRDDARREDMRRNDRRGEDARYEDARRGDNTHKYATHRDVRHDRDDEGPSDDETQGGDYKQSKRRQVVKDGEIHELKSELFGIKQELREMREMEKLKLSGSLDEYLYSPPSLTPSPPLLFLSPLLSHIFDL